MVRVHLLLSGMVRIACHGVLFMSNITWSSAIILNQTKIFFQSPNPGLSHVSSHSNLPAVTERADHVRLSLHLYRSSNFFFSNHVSHFYHLPIVISFYWIFSQPGDLHF